MKCETKPDSLYQQVKRTKSEVILFLFTEGIII